MPISQHHRHDVPVVWTRGPGCRELAELLGGAAATQVDGDLTGSCIRHGALVMVARRLTSFDLCSVAVPHGFEPQETTSIVAAVGGGPHSPLAAAIALRLGYRLDVPVRALYAYARPGPVPPVRRVLPQIAERFPDLPIETVHAPNPAEVVAALPAGTLLVTGAPGGSWFQRQFFGAGARILHRAPGGTIVVRLAPRRVYQAMEPPCAYGPEMRVADAVVLGLGDVLVASGGVPLGAVAVEDLHTAPEEEPLGELVQEVPHLVPDEPMEDALLLFDELDHLTVLPVVDQAGRLVGVLRREERDAPALPWAG